jgi:hypothetical protein
VGVVGIHNDVHASLPQACDALLIIIPMNDVPVIIPGKGIPYGVKKLVRK